MIARYFAERGDPTAADAWRHVYRLLLWIDRTTGLAHCFESDKSQPGRRWYGRSLAFHDWVSSGLGVSPIGLTSEVDYLFRRVTEDLAMAALRRQEQIAAAAVKQRAPYAGRDFPVPGEDPELMAIIEEALGEYLVREPPAEVRQAIVQRIRRYMALENKRKNLVGEGFEDVLVAIIRRVATGGGLDVAARRPLDELPGFQAVRRGEKRKRVDVAMFQGEQRRTIITAKWSIRADREEQFKTDLDDYVQAKADNLPFSYVLITNEFDPARLKRACERVEGNALMFARVVHSNTGALLAAYGAKPERSAADVVRHIERGRLMSLGDWLALVGTA